MKRRNFLQTGFNGLMAPIFIPGSFKPLSATVQPASTCSFDDRVLVIIYLAGANDIINTAVPLNDYNIYEAIRPTIKLPDNMDPNEGLIHLNNDVHNEIRLGLHPNLGGFKRLYDDDKLGIIQRTGYPTPNRSHFASEDILLKGIDGVQNLGSEKEGWVGRFLMDKHPTYKGLPFGEYLDPLGIILGDTPDTGFHTQDQHDMEINLSGLDPTNFNTVLAGLSGQPYGQTPQTDHGSMLEHLIAVEKSTQVYSERIQEIYDKGENEEDYNYLALDNHPVYSWQKLPDQLKTIAKFIHGGSTTKVYMARMGGWDTHNNQIDRHGVLMSELGYSLETFQKDLDSLQVSNRVMTVVFSEFGRKLTERADGTDHGTLSSMFVVGNHINKAHSINENDGYLVDQGIFGKNISLAEADILQGNLNSNSSEGGAADPAQQQHDYRSVFASILQDWLGASKTSLQAAFPSTAQSIIDTHIPIIKPAVAVNESCPYVPIPPAVIYVNLKVFLEGFYNANTGMMNTELLSQGLIPFEQPFGDKYFDYYGDEMVDGAFDSTIVDWLLLEAYDSNGLLKKRQAVLLREDGFVANLDGSVPLTIDNIYPEKHKIALHHKSHLGVLIKQEIDVVDGATYGLNISLDQNSVLGNKQIKLIDQSLYGLIAGDLDQNGLVNTEDMGIWKRGQNSFGYQNADMNASGSADLDDYSLWKSNRSKIGNPLLHENLKK